MDNNSNLFRTRKRGPKLKLTRAQMEAVRIAHAESEASMDDIAARFHVTKQTIYNVLKRLREEQAEMDARRNPGSDASPVEGAA